MSEIDATQVIAESLVQQVSQKGERIQRAEVNKVLKQINRKTPSTCVNVIRKRVSKKN